MKKDVQEKIRHRLKQNLRKRGRGSKIELADYLGTNRTAITHMLTAPKTREYRVITADEIIKIAEFFDKTLPFFELETTSSVHKEFYDIVNHLSPKGQENLGNVSV